MATQPGIIFDMDGVIVHSNPTHKKAIQQFCKKHEQEVSEDFLQNRIYGRTNKEFLPELFGGISPKKLKALADEKEQLFRDMFEPLKHRVPGILAFLDQLKENDIPTAVATSAPVENADYILSELGIESYFDVVLDSSHVTKGKPEPEIYHKAAKALQREPQNCIIFEDSVAGVEAARQAGAQVVGVCTTHTEEELAPCDLFIGDFVGLGIKDLLSLATATN